MKLVSEIEVADPGLTAVDVLGSHSGLPRQAIKQAMHKGAVWLHSHHGTRRVRRADRILNPGECLHLYYDTNVLDQRPPAASLIADRQVFSVWAKPCGMFSQGSRWGDHCSITRWVETRLRPQRPAFLTHRLDRATTGLMIIAHGKRAAAYLSARFREREIDKTYTALVHGRFPDRLTLTTDIDARSAITHAECTHYDPQNDCSTLIVRIETGRKHQIRRHLAGAGHPIIGDRLHGRASASEERDLCLAASALSFVPPDSGQVERFTLPDVLLPWRCGWHRGPNGTR